MFGLGLGEIIIIFLLIFLICPKDIPKILKKIGDLFMVIEKLKTDIIEINQDIQDTIKDDEINSKLDIKKDS